MATLSVIMALYNERPQDAIMAIDSIINQTFSDFELIVILDNPENNELRILLERYVHKDNRILFKINETNLGLPETLNRAIELASGEYIARMDGDDISYPERFEIQLSYLKRYPSLDLIGSNAIIIDENNQRIGTYKKLKSNFAQQIITRKASINLIHPTWLGKTEWFKKLKYRNFFYVEDYDFIARATYYGIKMHNIAEPLIATRIFQNKIVSVSRIKAFEQLYNARKCREWLNFAIKYKTKEYPSLHSIYYPPEDRERYQRIIPDLNALRTSLKTGKKINTLKFLIRILTKCPIAITYRAKVAIWQNLLKIIDPLCLIFEQKKYGI
ncbi:MAG: glycosyltransferase [Bacteroides sp.]|nr:glycosyltransferase [Bacteroides sp.]MBD5376067.1 glycosyltransferase [Bacteroides sp.]